MINGVNNSEESLIEVLTRIARDLEKVLVGIWVCGGLLGFISVVLLVRILIGR